MPRWSMVLLVAMPGLAVAQPDGRLARAADADPAVRADAASELAAQPTDDAVRMLILMLRHDVDPSVRRAAADAMATTRMAGLAPFLEEAAVSDPDPAVRDAARMAKRRLWIRSRQPRLAAAYSALCPGCGHFYLQMPGRGAAILAPTVALLGGGIALMVDNDEVPELGNPDDPNLDAKDPVGFHLLITAQNLWAYGVFAAYRDARLLRNNEGYRLPVSREGVVDLATAPFRPRVLARPWVWAGVPVAVGAATALVWAAAPEDLGRGSRSLTDGGDVNFLGRRYDQAPGVALGEAYFATLFVPVAVGEEALFRGVVQPALSERLGVWEGWALASAIFGAVHIFNFVGPGGDLEDAAVAVPFITAVGSYIGVASIKTGFQLETSVAVHFWYDFALSTIGFIADPDHQPFVARFAVPF